MLGTMMSSGRYKKLNKLKTTAFDKLKLFIFVECDKCLQSKEDKENNSFEGRKSEKLQRVNHGQEFLFAFF